MTQLPESTVKKLGLVIDLDTCVGCHACVISCKGWNTENYGAPLSDQDAYGGDPSGTFLNRVHSYEVQPEDGAAQLIHFPKSCLHCDDAPCVTVCPTGASYKRVEDGIVLVNEADCIGCSLCAWACPYGARHFGDLGDPDSAVSQLVADRGGFDLMPEQGTKPVNKYLPPRPKDAAPDIDILAPFLDPIAQDGNGFVAWLDRALSALPGGAR